KTTAAANARVNMIFNSESLLRMAALTNGGPSSPRLLDPPYKNRLSALFVLLVDLLLQRFDHCLQFANLRLQFLYAQFVGVGRRRRGYGFKVLGIGAAGVGRRGPVHFLVGVANANRIDFVPAGYVFGSDVDTDAVGFEIDFDGNLGHAHLGIGRSRILAFPQLDFGAVQLEGS